MAQLRDVGLGAGAVEYRLRRGRLRRLHRGVYAFGHAELRWRGRLWAAVLACGGPAAAVLSHRTAAALHDLMQEAGARIDVITLRAGAPTENLRVHRSVTLRPTRDVIHQPDGLPLTTPARTLTDLAATTSPHRLERLCHRAEMLRLLDARAIDAVLLTAPSTKGARALKRALTTLESAEPDLTRSELEEAFLSLIAQHDLPRPRANARVHGYEVDFHWPDHNLIVETDGAATHLTRRAFENDRRRDAALTAAGHRVVRFTHAQVTNRHRATAATLRTLLYSPAGKA